jgi:hypothetical protein
LVRRLFALADPPTRFKKDPSFRLAVNFRCEATRKRIQVATVLRGPTYQVPGHRPDAPGELGLQQAQVRRIDADRMTAIGWPGAWQRSVFGAAFMRSARPEGGIEVIA